jgi:hypothetical protein
MVQDEMFCVVDDWVCLNTAYKPRSTMVRSSTFCTLPVLFQGFVHQGSGKQAKMNISVPLARCSASSGWCEHIWMARTGFAGASPWHLGVLFLIGRLRFRCIENWPRAELWESTSLFTVALLIRFFRPRKGATKMNFSRIPHWGNSDLMGVFVSVFDVHITRIWMPATMRPHVPVCSESAWVDDCRGQCEESMPWPWQSLGHAIMPVATSQTIIYVDSLSIIL